jgi:hypothetical protein
LSVVSLQVSAINCQLPDIRQMLATLAGGKLPGHEQFMLLRRTSAWDPVGKFKRHYGHGGDELARKWAVS